MVLVGIGELTTLEDVLDRDEALEGALRVDYRELLDPVFSQQTLGFVERRPLGRGDEAVFRHHLTERTFHILLEL